MSDTKKRSKAADRALRPTGLSVLAGDVARCDGVGDASLAEWREGCDTCLRRTAAHGKRVVMMLPPPIIVFECEFLIEPHGNTQPTK